MNISIHKASLAEQEQADKNSYSTWGKDESVEEYLARCKSSVRRGKAQCWVLTVDGKSPFDYHTAFLLCGVLMVLAAGLSLKIPKGQDNLYSDE